MKTDLVALVSGMLGLRDMCNRNVDERYLWAVVLSVLLIGALGFINKSKAQPRDDDRVLITMTLPNTKQSTSLSCIPIHNNKQLKEYK